jgi:hypothetical protein
MARQIGRRMVWNKRNCGKIAHETGFLGSVQSLLRLNHRVDESASGINYGRIEDSQVQHDLTTAREAEVLFRRRQMGQ